MGAHRTGRNRRRPSSYMLAALIGLCAPVIALLVVQPRLLPGLPNVLASPTSQSYGATQDATPSAVVSSAEAPQRPRAVRPTRTPRPTRASTTAREALAEARRYQRNGEYAVAAEAYRALSRDFPGTEEAMEGSYRLGEALLAGHDYAAAVTAWREFLSSYPSGEQATAATFLLGRAYEAIGDRTAMLEAYRNYAALAGSLAPYAALTLAGVYLEGDDYESAIDALQGADRDDLPPGTRAEILEKLADAYEGSGKFAEAVERFEKASTLADGDAERANLQYRLAVAAAKAGNFGKAVSAVNALFSDYPETAAARQVLSRLGDLSVGVTVPFTRGVVLYYAGEYDAAIQAFAQQIAVAPQSALAAEARYFAGRAHQRAGDCESAIVVFDRLASTYPDSPRLPEASLNKGRCLSDMGRADEAREAFQQTATRYPRSAAAADALWTSARMLDDAGQWAAAAALYGALADTHPDDERASEALFRQGFLYWRLDDDRRAVATWDRLAAADAPPEARVKALYWAGKTLLALGLPSDAQDRLRKAVAAKDDDYYAARARDLAQEKLGLALAPPAEPPRDPDQEAVELERWALGLAGRPPSEAAASAEERAARLRQDIAFRRGEQLLALGRRREALRELDYAAQAHRDDLVWLVRYALYAREQDLASVSITTALRAFAVAKLDSLYAAPRGLQTLIYPACYEDLVKGEAEQNNLDPWLLSALIRQESLFNPNARSSADARGLTQVIPSTARAIADALGYGDFDPDDLYKPYVSIAFGARYLSVQLGNFYGNVPRALAAYNGGAGNARRWATVDRDAFLENIDFQETRAYVRLVSSFYEVYRQLYKR